MEAHEHSVVREGAIAGLLGAVANAVWFLVLDAAAGRPLNTPNALGRVFFGGDVNPGLREITPEAVLGFSVIQLVVFVLGGLVLTTLVHLVARIPALRMGLWLGLVVLFCMFAGLIYMLSVSTGERVPFWSAAGGNLLALGAMVWYLWRRHPRLDIRAPLGDEVRTTPHAPGAPREAPRR
jgi:hypothetical protein